MKRRKFLKGGVAALGAPLAVGTAGRLYSTPASVQPRDISDLDKFKLPLSKAKVPSELWDGLSKVAKLWENVLTNPSESTAFHKDPTGYLGSIGLDASDRTLATETVVLLRAIADPAVKTALAKSDYVSVFSQLIDAGVFTSTDPSALQSHVEQIFRENIEEIQMSSAAIQPYVEQTKQRALLASIDSGDTVLSDDDIVSLSQVLVEHIGAGPQPMCTAVALCVVAVGIAATVVAYVSVVIAATVGILAAVFISAAVKTAIVVGGTNPESNRFGTDAGLVSSSFTGEFVKLDPAAMRNAERAVRLAVLTDDAGLQVYSAKQAVQLEVHAVLTAMRNVNLLPVSQDVLPNIIDVVTRYSWKCLGLDRV